MGRLEASGFMEKLFDETVERAMKKGLVNLHASADGSLVRANASFKRFAPIEVNRNRILVGVNVEVFRGPASESAGCVAILDRVGTEHGYKPKTLGADKGYFAQGFLNSLFERGIAPHVAVQARGKESEHRRVRMRQRGKGCRLSQR